MIGVIRISPPVECDGGAVRRISGDEMGIKDNKIRREIYRIRSPRELKN
jgi:hypothetical protein